MKKENKEVKITAEDLRRAAKILAKGRKICGICGKYKNHSHYVIIENSRITII